MFSILYNIIISPIELVVEVVFELMWRLVGQRQTNQGLAVIGVSLAISLLTLPLYRRADVVQQKERDLQKSLSYWVNHIKKYFKGDERYMMLQTYYRQNGYSPIMALNGALSLLLEIPFFMAAYHFLSHLEALKGASFGLISDLGAPDGLIHVGPFSLNLLPVLMTAINCLSAAIYLKGFPLKDKIQTYGMALIFLVLLYNSPAGLVVYWTCNNIFSLVKNVFYKLKNPKKVAVILCAFVASAFATGVFASGILNSRKKCVALLVFLFCAYIPLILYSIKRKGKTKSVESANAEEKALAVNFFLPALVLALFTGVLIPSSVISSSPSEFIDITAYKNPLHFIINSSCYALGFFLLWSGIIYAMLEKKGKNVFSFLLYAFSLAALVNYMCFGRNLGIISTYLTFDNEPSFSSSAVFINLIIVMAIFALCFFVFQKKKNQILRFFSNFVILSCLFILSLVNITIANNKLSSISYITNSNQENESLPTFNLSRTGKNVIVLMLDRAINGFFPLLLEEKPELKEQFKGFTYYPNTISFGAHTIYGAPPLFGGYEYTPTQMNERKDKNLREKHNEALKVMPVLFSENGYDVTVCDAPDANYQHIPDLSIYDDYPEIKKYITIGAYTNKYLKNEKNELTNDWQNKNKRNFFCYSIFKIVPVILQNLVYDGGDYYDSSDGEEISRVFVDNYEVLASLVSSTSISDSSIPSFIMMNNETTHQPCRLYLPDYTLVPPADNEDVKAYYNESHSFKTPAQLRSYHVNMAAMIELGKWFEFLQKNGVWDNTRIILVSDHGYTNDIDTMGLEFFDYMIMKNPKIDVEWCNPLLIVKDFNSNAYSTSTEFMTNADVPTIALKNIIENPKNPFTGKEINSADKTAYPQLITSSHHSSAHYHANGERPAFDTSDGHWFSVHDDIFKEENWKQLD